MATPNPTAPSDSLTADSHSRESRESGLTAWEETVSAANRLPHPPRDEDVARFRIAISMASAKTLLGLDSRVSVTAEQKQEAEDLKAQIGSALAHPILLSAHFNAIRRAVESVATDEWLREQDRRYGQLRYQGDPGDEYADDVTAQKRIVEGGY